VRGGLQQRNREARITRTGNPGFHHHSIVPDLSAEATLCYALKELPQPQAVFACGFLIENPDPWTLST
jgi:hypothetical protein